MATTVSERNKVDESRSAGWQELEAHNAGRSNRPPPPHVGHRAAERGASAPFEHRDAQEPTSWSAIAQYARKEESAELGFSKVPRRPGSELRIIPL